MNKKTYKLFGFIPLWSVTVASNIDQEELYKSIVTRFTKELGASVQRQAR